MYAPDLVEIKRKDGTKEYYLFPHSRGRNREAIVCKGNRPDGPFTPIRLNKDGTRTLPGSFPGFDLLFLLRISQFLTILTMKSDSVLMDFGDSKDQQQRNWIRTRCILSDREQRLYLTLFLQVQIPVSE